MFELNKEDMSISVTRGDVLYFDFYADDNGKNYKFKPGDVVRIAVAVKKDMSTVVLQKDFPVEDYTEKVRIYLTKHDTKIGNSISKPTDYWYEIVLNPFDEEQTIVGYDEEGPKLFRLFPEAEEINEPDPAPEDIPIVDQELDMTSTRPVGNQAISRAYQELLAGYERTHAAVADLHVTPETFGAIGDGVADDTESLQAAIDYSFLHNRPVYLRKSYMISSPLKVKGVDVTAETIGAEIIGNGYAHIVAGASLANMIELTPDSNDKTYGIKISHLILDGKNIVTDGIFSKYPTSECVFEHLTINQCNNGVHITNNCYLNNFRAVRAYHCKDYGILFENGNNTSNVFEKCYIDTCANAYKVNGQYSTMISCCADNITGIVFELNSFTGALVGCGTEANKFETMLKAYTNSNIVLMGGLYFGNSDLAGYYFDIGAGCRVGVYNCTINYADADSEGALCHLENNAHLTLKDTYISKAFNGENSLSNTSFLYTNTPISDMNISVTLDNNNEAVIPLSPTTYHILRIVSTNRSGWLFTPIVTESDVYKVKATTSGSYLPTITDKAFTLNIKYITERLL